MNRFAFLSRLLVVSIVTISGCAQRAQTQAPPQPALATPATQPMDPTIARIRDEGLNHSKAMETLDYICDVIGPRLTGSPNCKRASEWTRDTLASWGLSHAHVEKWGPFGRGWEVTRFSMQVIKPYTIVLNGYPKAWSPGLDAEIEAPVVYVDASKDEDLEKFKGKLSIPLMGATRGTLFKWLGNPAMKDTNWDAFQTSYGIVILYYNKTNKVNKIQFSTETTSSINLCE